MSQDNVELNIARIMPTVISEMPVGLTLLDLEGHILYFNDYAAKILDRKPEYLGRDVREFHKIPKSNEKIGVILDGYKHGDKSEHHWQLPREGLVYGIRVAPLIVNGQTVGLIHTAQLQGRAKN